MTDIEVLKRLEDRSVRFRQKHGNLVVDLPLTKRELLAAKRQINKLQKTIAEMEAKYPAETSVFKQRISNVVDAIANLVPFRMQWDMKNYDW